MDHDPASFHRLCNYHLSCNGGDFVSRIRAERTARQQAGGYTDGRPHDTVCSLSLFCSNLNKNNNVHTHPHQSTLQKRERALHVSEVYFSDGTCFTSVSRDRRGRGRGRESNILPGIVSLADHLVRNNFVLLKGTCSTSISRGCRHLLGINLSG